MDTEKIISSFPKKSHTCSIYRRKEDKLSVVIPFFKGALLKNELCVIIVDTETRRIICSMLEAAGFDMKTVIERSQPKFFTKEETYLQDGNFDPERTINLFHTTQKEALYAGYDGLRVIGVGSDILATKLPGTEKFLEYEAKINSFFASSLSLAICQYDEHAISEEVLRDVILTHPQVILYGTPYLNPSYMDQYSFLGAVPARFNQTYQSLKERLVPLH